MSELVLQMRVKHCIIKVTRCFDHSEKWGNNRTDEIGLVIPTPGFNMSLIISHHLFCWNVKV